jgi:hypothetical protein
MEKQPLLVESPDENLNRENERYGQFSGVMQPLQGGECRCCRRDGYEGIGFLDGGKAALGPYGIRTESRAASAVTRISSVRGALPPAAKMMVSVLRCAACCPDDK